MARLYYERPNKGFRGPDREGSYMEKIVKIIPAEIIGIYVFFVGIVDTFPVSISDIIKWTVFLSMLILIPLAFSKMNTKKKPIRNHIIISCLAFVVWAYSLSGEKMLGSAYFHPAIASVSLMLFTAFTPYVPLDK